MKKMKKILSLVLALAMVLGMALNVSAGDAGENGKVGDSDDTGQIVIQNVEKDVTIELYKIVEADYDDNDVFVGFKATDAAYETILKGEGEKVDYTQLANISEETINALGVNKVDSTKVNGVTFTYEKTADAVEETDTTAAKKETGTYTSEAGKLGIGMYLVVLTGSDTTIYNYAVASIYYEPVTDEDGNTTGNIIVDGTGTDGKPLNIKDATLFAKSIDHPTLEKKANAAVGNSVNIGDKVKYEVEITSVPYYNGEYPVFKVEDTLSSGLTLDMSAEGQYKVTVTGYEKGSQTAVDLTGNENITITKTDNKLTVNFVKVTNGERTYALNDYAGGKVVITYYATLNDSAVINQNSNNNSVELRYTTDSKVDKGDDGDGEKDKETYTYTFDIDGGITGTDEETRVTEALLVKTDGTVVLDKTTNKVTNPLEGAVFGIYTDENCKTPYTRQAVNDSEGNEVVAAFDGKVTSDENGLLAVRGLAAGSEDKPAVYYLKETAAPKGYSLNTNVFKIQIWAEYYSEANAPEGMKAGQLKSWSIKINDADTSTFNVTSQGGQTTVTIDGGKVNMTAIPNTTLSSLPSTGGIGTTIFTIGGCAIMIIAAGLYFVSRRKSEK